MGTQVAPAANSERLELYRIIVETVIANEARRHNINSVFFSLFLGLLAAASAIEEISTALAAVASMVLSFFWYQKVSYLKDLAAAKFKVLLRLEKHFCDQPFEEEWRYLGFGDGKARRRFTLSEVELLVPLCIFWLACAYLGNSVLAAYVP